MSMGWIETRVKACEERLEYLIRYLQDLVPQLRSGCAGGAYGQLGLWRRGRGRCHRGLLLRA